MYISCVSAPLVEGIIGFQKLGLFRLLMCVWSVKLWSGGDSVSHIAWAGPERKFTFNEVFEVVFTTFSSSPSFSGMQCNVLCYNGKISPTTSFKRHKWPQIKMYSIFATIFWHDSCTLSHGAGWFAACVGNRKTFFSLVEILQQPIRSFWWNGFWCQHSRIRMIIPCARLWKAAQ